MKTLLQIFIALMMCASFGYATIIHVPADATSIQEGINMANTGDTVLVWQGVYFENINFKGKAITVASRYVLDGKKSHIAGTIINGSRPSHPDSGSVVYFINGEDVTSILCGFTITGGTGTITPEGRAGGGVCALHSSAHIKNNYIVKNRIHYDFDTFGGGIYSWDISDRDCIIENNVIAKNKLISDQSILFSLGGGIYTNGVSNTAIRISGNEISNNSVSAQFAWGGGVVPSNFGSADYFIENNIVSGNKVTASIFGASGGIDVYNHFPVIRNNIISNNYAPFGGGISFEIYPAPEAMSTESQKGPRGRARMSSQKIKNTVTEIAPFSNNTLYHNSADYAGGGIVVPGVVVPQFMNFIIWKNKAPDGPQISGTADVQYSDVEGGWAGTGNIKKNPRLLGLLLFLGFRSPCIDAGNSDPMYNDPERTFRPGYAQLPARGTIRNDMGAYGGPGAAGYWNFFKFAKELQAVQFEEEDAVAEIDNQKKMIRTDQFPNPFNSQTTFQFELPSDGFVSLKIYNVLGQQVANLISQRLSAGSHKYVWNANDVASGIYLYRLEANGTIQQNKLILMK